MAEAGEEYGRVAAALQALGLAARGGFHPEPEDRVPPLPEGRPAGSVILVGWIGGEGWAAFASSPEAADGQPDPLDRWSRRCLSALAQSLRAAALFPFGGPPYLPFQRWAAKAEPSARSPLGLAIHPRYGLWHAWRGALAFAGRLALPEREELTSPCETCSARPCLAACPVGAFTEGGYDVPRCLAFLAEPAGNDCLSFGCRARRACPVGAELRHSPPQAAFHLRAFRDAQLRRGAGG